jgi:hypothetical protein
MNDRIILKGHSKLLKPIITEIMAFHQLLEAKDVGTIYAYHNDLNSVRRVGKPKLTLYFLEDTDFVKKAVPNKRYEGLRRKDGLIRVRLMDETTQSFSKANATALANKIKAVFGVNGGFVWNKGKTMYSYSDWELGYQFQLLCRSETEAKRIVTATLSLQSHSPDWKNFNTVKNNEEALKYPENPGNHIVMGETLPLPQERSLVDVRFQYSYVNLDGVKEPVDLYSRVNRRAKALVI